jgi:DNA-binding IclR family transcriptional regulator
MLELVTENPGLSIQKYADLAGINKTNAHKHLQWLRDNGHVTKDWRPVESGSVAGELDQ